jgi:hypothetical protein
MITTYRVHGTAHGVDFDETGFEEEAGAMAYASSIIDGDLDSTIAITTMIECPYCEQPFDPTDAVQAKAHGLGESWILGVDV